MEFGADLRGSQYRQPLRQRALVFAQKGGEFCIPPLSPADGCIARPAFANPACRQQNPVNCVRSASLFQSSVHASRATFSHCPDAQSDPLAIPTPTNVSFGIAVMDMLGDMVVSAAVNGTFGSAHKIRLALWLLSDDCAVIKASHLLELRCAAYGAVRSLSANCPIAPWRTEGVESSPICMISASRCT